VRFSRPIGEGVLEGGEVGQVEIAVEVIVGGSTNRRLFHRNIHVEPCVLCATAVSATALAGRKDHAMFTAGYRIPKNHCSRAVAHADRASPPRA
jgi:hypothetical protein